MLAYYNNAFAEVVGWKTFELANKRFSVRNLLLSLEGEVGTLMTAHGCFTTKVTKKIISENSYCLCIHPVNKNL